MSNLRAHGKLRETCHEDLSARSVLVTHPQVVISGLERPNLLSARLGFVNFRMSNLRAHGKLRETCHEDLSARSVLVSYPQVVISGLERPNLLSARLGFVNFRMSNLRAHGKLRETCHEDLSARSVLVSYPQVVISGLERPNLLSVRLGFVNFRMSILRAHGNLRETCHEDLSARSVLVSYPVVISGLERPNLLSARLGFVNFRMSNLRAHGKLRETCHEDLSARSVLVSYPQVVISGLERPNLLSVRLGFVNFRMSNLRAHGNLRETCHEDLSARSVLVSYPQVVISGLERPNLLSARLGFVNFRMSNLRAHGKLRETCHEDLSARSVLVSYPQVVISGLERPNLLSARLGFVNFRMSNLRAHGKLRETCHEDLSARSVLVSYPQVVISGLERPNLLSVRLGFVNFRMSILRAHGNLRETCHEDLSARSVLVSYPQVVISGLERPNLLSARLGFVNFRMSNLRAHGKLRET